MVSDTFCVLPFLHMKVGVEGIVSPCCRFPVVTDQSNFFHENISQRSLRQIFESDEYEKIRKAMLEGRPVTGCRQCYKDEAAGAKSLRMTQNMKYGDLAEQIAVKPGIRFLEVAVGNLCNLKCIMCNSNFSHKWKSDESTLINEYGFQEKAPYATSTLVDNALLFDREFLAQLTDIKVVGGEPLLQAKMIAFLESLASMGLASQVAVEIYTNCTHWPSERALKALGAFREVQLLFSVDGVGQQAEYVRYPTKWENVETNIKKWLEIPSRFPGIYLSCNYTINFLNAFYYDRIADWWHDLTQDTPYEKHLETTFVNDPAFLSMSLLPEQAKQAVATKLSAYRDRNQHRDYVRYNVKRILSRLALKPETDLARFFHYVDSLDKIRHTSYRDTFPELYEMIQSSCSGLSQ